MTDDDLTDDDLTPWTPAGAERLRAAAAELAAAVAAHAAAVSAVTGDDGMPEVFAASDRLLPAVLAYADAQFDLTGNDFPFGVLHSYADDDGADEDGLMGVEGTEGPVGSGSTAVSVLQRHDLLVTDEAAVLTAARRAELGTAPDGDDTGTDLGQALARLASVDGWDALGDVPGLRSTGRSVLVVGRELDPDADPDADPDDAEDEGGELLYSQHDVFPG